MHAVASRLFHRLDDDLALLQLLVKFVHNSIMNAARRSHKLLGFYEHFSNHTALEDYINAEKARPLRNFTDEENDDRILFTRIRRDNFGIALPRVLFLSQWAQASINSMAFCL